MSTARASSPARVAAPEGAPPAGWLRVVIGVAVWIAIVGATAYGIARLHGYEQRPLFLEGARVPSGDPEPFVRALASELGETEVTIDAGSQVVRASRRELGVDLRVEDTLAAIRAARGSAPIWERVWAIAAPEDRFRFAREVREDDVRAFAEELRARVAIEPAPVRRDGSGGRPGLALDLTRATSAITEALRADRLVVRVPVLRIEAPTRTLRDARTARFTEVVSEYETRYGSAGDLWGRANNVELAARALDGRLLEPDEELSFNEVVGERTFERGFSPAVELTGGGRRTQGIGGGVCQVAATLHAAAFFAGFEILEHHPHTRNSVYIPAGLDAAVSWPNKDVRVRNTLTFPVRVRATAYRGRLKVTLMGAEHAPRVVWSTRVISTTPRGTERVVIHNLPVGTSEVLDEGEDGTLLERTRTIFWPDGASTQTDVLRYPVVHRLVHVGPGAAP